MSSQLNRNPQEPLEATPPTLFDRIFRDQNGNIVIIQMPNLPALLGLTAALLQFLLPEGILQTTAELVAFGVLFTWAWLELFEGVNYFRRGLGLVVLIGLLVLKLYSGL